MFTFQVIGINADVSKNSVSILRVNIHELVEVNAETVRVMPRPAVYEGNYNLYYCTHVPRQETRGALPPLPHTSSWTDASFSTGTTLTEESNTHRKVKLNVS
jgi:hypothetical protein